MEELLWDENIGTKKYQFFTPLLPFASRFSPKFSSPLKQCPRELPTHTSTKTLFGGSYRDLTARV